MNSLLKGVIIILIIRGSSGGILTSKISDALNSATEELASSASSLVSAVSHFNASDVLDSLNIEKGVLDLNGLLQKFNVTNNVDIKSILTSVNVSVSANGLLDLKSVLSNLGWANFQSILNLEFSDGVKGLFSTIKTLISKINVTEYLNTLVNNTEDGLLDFKGLAEKYTGAAEEYDVTTEDGYILKVFHIPGDGEVVLLSHAFFSSADDFILRGNTSLIYMLVQKGYDVWVMNYRGNRYSRRHTTLNPDTDAEFWNFSMHEYGYYDLSAVIDFVLENTEKEKLSVIGHSEGNANIFVLTSTKPEYNDKIEVFVALSPVCYLTNSGLTIKTLIGLWPVINGVLLANGVEETLGDKALIVKLLQVFCSQGALGYNVCVKVGFGAISGYYPENLEQEFSHTVLAHYPAGSSRKNFDHYAQVANSGVFAQYDYGVNNTNKYNGSETPPKYDFNEVTCKVIIFAAENDEILGIKDAERVRDQVPNAKYFVVEDNKFTHGDYIWGENAHVVVYPKVLAQLCSD